jgi:transcription antitermination factor NusG
MNIYIGLKIVIKGGTLNKDELKFADCVKVISGKYKGKQGIFEGVDYQDYRCVRILLNGEHIPFPIQLSNLEKCYK